MPPEQQNPSPPSSPPPGQLPYQVPDYLHLDPATGQVKESNKKFIFLVLGILLVLLGGVSAYVWFAGQISPEQRFDQALENAMNTPYVSREMSLSSPEANIKLSSTGSTDLRDPYAPKSTINYTYSQPSQTSSTAEKQLDISGDVVVTSKTGLFGRLTQAPSDGLNGSTQLNQWYAFTASGSATYDLLDLEQVFNTLICIVPMGDFGTPTSQKLLRDIKSDKIYTLQKSEVKNNTTVYTVMLNNSNLDNFAQKLAISYSLTYRKPPVMDNVITPVTITVDNSNNRISRIAYTSKLGTNKSAATNTINISYPKSLTINAPEAKQ